MKVGRIAHASLVIESEGITCFMDPVLTEPFLSNSTLFNPRLSVDGVGARSRCQAIVLSHEHLDHLDVRSLAMLGRTNPVILPHGATLITRVLERLGFRDLRPLRGGEQIALADLVLTATPSHVDFPEMGVIFEADGCSMWNMVDTTLTPDVIADIVRDRPRLDLVFPTHIDQMEDRISVDALGGSFSLQHHDRYLQNAVAAKPRCIVPGACGFFFTLPWLNDRMFPMTAEQFSSDIQRMDPNIQGLVLASGDVISAKTLAVIPNGLDFVRCTSPDRVTTYDWRPDRGVPPLQDADPYGYGSSHLRRSIDEFLNGELLQVFSQPSNAEWRRRLAGAEVLWRLEVVYPDGTTEVRSIDFQSELLVWQVDERKRFAKIHTTVTASSVVGVLEGDVSVGAASQGSYRVFTRLYAVASSGIQQIGDRRDEPLARALITYGDERFLDKELRRLGF